MAIYNLIETVGMMILYYSFLFIVYKILVWEKVRRDIEEEIPVAREASSQEEDSDKEDEDSDEEDEDSDDEDEEDEDGDDETSLPEEQSTKEE